MVPIIKRKEAAKSSAMLNRIFSDQLGDLQNALSRTGQRQALLTENLANANVPHYKRHDIDFHVALQSQMKGPSLAASDQGSTDSSSLSADGNNVDIEREVTSISETDLHYQALTQLVTNYFSELKSAIREGK
jgi:flagellar basal-body rod protein FlgB